MMEELRKYNEQGASQQGPTATRQRPQRPNAEPESSDSQEAQASSRSWRPQHSSTERSSEASGSSSAKSRRRKSQAYRADHATKAKLENVMQELQQLKKVRLGQDSDPEMESNPLSLVIQSNPISPAIRIPKEKFSKISDPTDHVAAFESRMDFYGASDATKCRAFSATFNGVARSWYDSLSAQSITSFKCF